MGREAEIVAKRKRIRRFEFKSNSHTKPQSKIKVKTTSTLNSRPQQGRGTAGRHWKALEAYTIMKEREKTLVRLHLQTATRNVNLQYPGAAHQPAQKGPSRCTSAIACITLSVHSQCLSVPLSGPFGRREGRAGQKRLKPDLLSSMRLHAVQNVPVFFNVGETNLVSKRSNWVYRVQTLHSDSSPLRTCILAIHMAV